MVSKPLYRLDISDGTLGELRELLRRTNEGRTRFHLERYTDLYFWRLFVLYGAFCFARNFAGNHWTWQLLENDLKVSGFSFQSPSFKTSFKDAAHFWGYDIPEDRTGKKYIGSLLILAGLSLKLLHSTGGLTKQFDWANRKLAKNPRLSKKDLSDEIIRRFSEDLCSLDSERVADILTEAVFSIREFFAQYGGQKKELSADEAVKLFPAFKQMFPCAVILEDDYRKVIAEAGTTLKNVERDKPILTVERFMIRIGDEFRLTTQVKFGNLSPSPEALEAQFSVPIQSCGAFKARLFVGKALFAHIQSDGSKTAIHRSQLKPLIFREENALRQICCRLESNKGDVSVRPLEKGEPLDLGEPQVFFPDEQHYEYLGSGAVRTYRKKLFITLPKNADVYCDDAEHQPVCIGTLLGCKVLETQSSSPVVIRTTSDEYIVTPGAAKSGAYFELNGNLAPIETLEDYPVFLGKPDISAFDEDGEPIRHAFCQVWRNGFGDIVSEPDPHWADLYTINVLLTSNGRTFSIKRFKAVVLPHHAKTEYSAGKLTEDSPGFITLEGWGEPTVYEEDLAEDNPGLEVKPVRADDRIDLVCKRSDSSAAPRMNDRVPRIQVKLRTRPCSEAFTLLLTVPYAAVQFILDGVPLMRDAEITTAQAEKLVIYAASPSELGRHAPEYTVEFSPNIIENTGKDGDHVRDRILIPLQLSAATGAGMLTYEDFKDDLRKVMRRALVTQDASRGIYDGTVCIAVEHSQRKTRLYVNYRGAEIISCTNTDDGTPVVMLVDSDRAQAELVFRELFPKTDEEGKCDSHGRRIKAGIVPPQAVPVPTACTASQSPWLVYVQGDQHFRIQPAVVGLDYCEEQWDGKAVYPFLSMKSLWNGEFSREEWPQFRELLLEELKSPSSPQWQAFGYQRMLLGTHGFAALPFWKAFRQNVACGFVFALIMDLLVRHRFAARRAGDPTILYAVGRRQNWRWDLLPVSVISEALQIATAFLEKDEETAELVDLTLLLDDDVFENAVLARKFKAAALMANTPFVGSFEKGKYWDEMSADYEPYSVLAGKPFAVLEGWLSDRNFILARKADALFILQSDPSVSRLRDAGIRLERTLNTSPVLAGPYEFLLRYLQPLLDAVVGNTKFDITRRHAAAAPFLAYYAWALAYGRTLDEYKHDIMRPMIRPAVMFSTDQALTDANEWTGFASRFAEVVANEYLKGRR